MEEQQGLARCPLAECLQNNSVCMCTLACVFGLIEQLHGKKTLCCHYCACAYVFLQRRQGSSVAPGQNFKYTACAKNVYVKNTPRANNMLSKAHVMHACTQGVKKRQTNRQHDGQIDKERRWTNGGCFQQKLSKPSIDLFTHRLMVTIIPIWLSDNTLHLISGHQTPPVIPDSWEAEKAKVQFNRFTARQNWVACGCLTKSFLSQSLYISGFTPMSIDESVTRPLPVTPASTTTWQIIKHYEEASSSLVTNGWCVSV